MRTTRILTVIIAAAAVAASAQSAPARQSSPWTYGVERDEMRDKSTPFAHCDSTGTIPLPAPNDGARARITLMSGTNLTYVEIAINRGIMGCPESGCTVAIRFDDAPAEEIQAYGSAAPFKAVSLFFEADMLRKLQAAKLLRVELPFYGAGTHVIRFDVAGLAWPPPTGEHPTP